MPAEVVGRLLAKSVVNGLINGSVSFRGGGGSCDVQSTLALPCSFAAAVVKGAIVAQGCFKPFAPIVSNRSSVRTETEFEYRGPVVEVMEVLKELLDVY